MINLTKCTYFCLLLLAPLLLSLPANAQTCSPAPAGLVSWWPGENSALDSRSLNNGTLQNGATFASGKVGQAFSLDGVDDFIKVNASASLNVGASDGFTIEAWVNPQANNGEPIVEFDSLTTVGVHLWTSVSGANNLFAGLNAGIQSPDNAVPLNQFTHVAVTYDKTTGLAQLFANGIIVGSLNVGIGVPATAFDMNIGGRTLFGLDKFHGKIDELSIYNRTLSLSEIQSIFNAGTAGKCKPTATVSPSGQVGWWSGDGNANDLAGANNGTLINGAGFSIGKVGQGFQFDNTNTQRVSVPDSISLDLTNAITIETWVSPEQFGGAGNNSTLVFKGNLSVLTSQSYGLLYNSDGTVTFRVGDGSTTLNAGSGAVLPLNTFSHIVGTYDGTMVKFYVNGVLTNSFPVSLGTILNTADPVIIGSNGVGPFVGKLDEVSIYSRAISQDEVTSIFNAGIAGKLKQNSTIDSNSLVSLWQGEGNGNDTRGINNGTLLDGTTFAAGKFGQAFQFVPNQRVLAPDSASLDLTNAVTIETWISPQQFGGAGNNSSVVLKGSIGGASGESYSLMFFANGSPALRLSNGSTIEHLFSAAILPLNTFSHIVGTYDGTTMKFYVNGVLTNSAVSSLGTLNNSTGPMLIGSNGIGPYDGKLDEVAIYNRALSLTEVRANYEAGNALSTTVGDARVTFPTITTAGITQQTPLDLSTLPSLPTGSTTTGLTYDIATTATFTGSPQVCFNLPSITDSTIFNNLRILHLESGVWQNRTGASNFASRTLCTSGLTSLSPFAIVNGFAPTAADSSISGRVVTARGRGVGNVIVQVSGGNLPEPRFARTSTFGNYRFDELEVGQTYVLSVTSRRYTFANPTRLVTLNEELTDEDFVVESK